MSKISRVNVLCEDILQDVFVSRFLKKWGLKRDRDFFVREDYPKKGDRGAGEKYVRDNYPNELKACRSRRAKTALIVVIDADNNTVEQRHGHLRQTCQAKQLNPRNDSDLVIHIIPKWHIETWLAWLDGIEVDENEKEKYKKSHQFKDQEKGCHSLVEKLADMCQNKQPLNNPPPSLTAACNEFDRIREILI